MRKLTDGLAMTDCMTTETEQVSEREQALLQALAQYGEYLSITGWHDRECPHRKIDMDRPCSIRCTRVRAALKQYSALIR